MYHRLSYSWTLSLLFKPSLLASRLVCPSKYYNQKPKTLSFKSRCMYHYLVTVMNERSMNHHMYTMTSTKSFLKSKSSIHEFLVFLFHDVPRCIVLFSSAVQIASCQYTEAVNSQCGSNDHPKYKPSTSPNMNSQWFSKVWLTRICSLCPDMVKLFQLFKAPLWAIRIPALRTTIESQKS